MKTFDLVLENKIVNAIISNPQYYTYLDKLILRDDFYFEHTKLLLGVIESIVVDLLPISEGSVMLRVIQQKHSDFLKQSGFIFEAIDRISFEEFCIMCENLKNYSTTRKVASLNDKIMKAMREDRAYDIVEYVGFWYSELMENSSTHKIRNNNEVVKSAIAQIEEAMVNRTKGQSAGVPTGFSNPMLREFYNDELIFFGGRPGMAKTVLMLELAKNASKQGFPTGIFAYEIKAEMLINRILSGQTESISYGKLKSGNISLDEFTAINKKYVTEINSLPIHWYDDDDRSIETFCYEAERMVKLHGVKAIYIDYFQLMEVKNSRISSREYDTVTHISKELKKCQKRLQVPIIALAQLSRELEKREGDKRRPTMQDFRSTGQIEQDANRMYGLYRPDYYGIKEFKEDWRDTHEFFVDCLKSRDGSEGSIKLYADVKTNRVRESLSELNLYQQAQEVKPYESNAVLNTVNVSIWNKEESKEVDF